MENIKFLFRGVSRNILIMGLVSLLTDLGSQIVFPLIPLYLASLGAWASIIGLVEGAAETTAAFLRVISGFISDKMKKRKPLLALWYSVSVLSKPLFALATIRPVVLGIRVLERMGKGLREAPRDALIAESTDPQYIGKAFGIQRAMDSIGGMLGAVIALYFFPLFGYRNMFLLAAVPGFLAIFTIMFIQEARKERANTRKRANDRYAKPEISFWQGIKVLPPKLLAFIGISAIFALGNFGYAFLLLKIKNVGGSDGDALLYFVLFTAIDTLVSIPAGILSDKRGRKTILLISYILFTGVAALLMMTSTMSWTIIAFVGFGMVYSILDGAQRAFVSELAPKEYRATALGMFYTAIGIVALPGGYLLGTLRDTVSPARMFGFSTFVGLVAIVGVVSLRRKK